MRKFIIVFGIFLTQLSFSQEELVFDGIKVKTSIKVDDGDSKTKLVLNGAGVRD